MIKVHEASIVARMDKNGLLYYEVKYKKVGDDDYTIGYGSYDPYLVKNWLGTEFEFVTEPAESNTSAFDSVHRPSHYTQGRKYEPRKVIADWGLNFYLGNAVKYIARAGRKGSKREDLEKAIQYIDFELEELAELGEETKMG